MHWKVADAITSKHLEERTLLLELCQKYKDYPREANWVHALAREVEITNRSVVLEAPYWSAYKPRRSPGWPKVDLWAEAKSPHRELYVEVKIANRRKTARRSIGYKPVGEVLRWWADDIWRLMTGPHRARFSDPVHSAFVVYAWGDVRIAEEQGALREVDGGHLDADKIRAALCATEADPSDPVAAFIAECRKHFGVSVTPAFVLTTTEGETTGEDFEPTCVQAIVVEWVQRRGAQAAAVEEWGGGARELA